MKKKVKNLKFQRLYIWPALFALVYSTLTFPGGLGKMIAGELDGKEVLTMLFDNKVKFNFWSQKVRIFRLGPISTVSMRRLICRSKRFLSR